MLAPLLRVGARRLQAQRRARAPVALNVQSLRWSSGSSSSGSSGSEDPSQRQPGQPVLDISVHPGGVPGAGGYHDLGGLLDGAGAVLAAGSDRPHAHWEKRVHALCGVLVSKGLLTVDEMRRGWEQLQPEAYDKMSYYEKWASSISSIMLERGALTEAMLITQRGPEVESDTVVRFMVGTVVRVKREAEFKTRWRKPHLRTPGYCHGCYGVVERVAGVFSSPEALAYGGRDLAARGSQPLYRVRFRQRDLWQAADDDTTAAGSADTVDVEIYQSWLEAGPVDELPEVEWQNTPSAAPAHGHGHGHGHSHGEDADHEHCTRRQTEEAAVALEEDCMLPEPPVASTLVGALLAKGVITGAELTAGIGAVDRLGQAGSSENAPGAVGAQLVARAWVDDDFKASLLVDANGAASSMGITASNATTTTVLTVVENTATVHNLIVCTLCSCYPLPILGLSPDWYKSKAYRARAVREPRAVLAEFGTNLDDGTELRVHDSTADLRYMVLPMRPEGTEGMTEDELRELVTRDSMIGVRLAGGL